MSGLDILSTWQLIKLQFGIHLELLTRHWLVIILLIVILFLLGLCATLLNWMTGRVTGK